MFVWKCCPGVHKSLCGVAFFALDCRVLSISLVHPVRLFHSRPGGSITGSTGREFLEAENKRFFYTARLAASHSHSACHLAAQSSISVQPMQTVVSRP